MQNKTAMRLRVGVALAAAAGVMFGSATPAHAIKNPNPASCLKDIVKKKYTGFIQDHPRAPFNLCFAEAGLKTGINWRFNDFYSGNNAGAFSWRNPNNGKAGIHAFKKNEQVRAEPGTHVIMLRIY